MTIIQNQAAKDKGLRPEEKFFNKWLFGNGESTQKRCDNFIARGQMVLGAIVAISWFVGTYGGQFSKPSEARNGWIQANCNSVQNVCLYVRNESRNGSIVRFQSKTTEGIARKRTGDCHTRQVSSIINGNMEDVKPGTMIDSALTVVCN